MTRSLSTFPIASVITGLALAMTAIGLYQTSDLSRGNATGTEKDSTFVANAPAQARTEGGLVVANRRSSSVVGTAATPVDPHLTMGSETCVKCHANEVKVWQSTPHFRTFEELHRRPAAKEIASRLGVRSIKYDGRCVDCHYTQQTDVASGNVHAIAGVSCESCHGSAKNWLDLHHDYGGEQVTRAMETPEHKQQRLQRSVAAGMRNPVNAYLVAQSCLRCHTTADEELVNVGGHPTGSLDFEFVSWSQGTLRHNFIESDGQSNASNTKDRLRVMFVSGMIADLEASLRATAAATQKAKFGVTSAKRADRAAKRLLSVSQKVSSKYLEDILLVYSGVTLKLNNRDELTQAADTIADLGYQFASETNGHVLAPLDAFIPPQTRWK
ncbi:cytochrome c family protein [Rhodopirellula sp. JC740]|uniref:Cytochrome c family protein n=1 Tax=Rhodopirellula halodulae TaxID=2894198 RepID=A0ABS8NMX4_9BACT|nr:cytochrome c family protein [Rhodopirellula sp. JC740]MCC9644944.1 cytochrome c family protein [Rhodopirellula sp. JC740]